MILELWKWLGLGSICQNLTKYNIHSIYSPMDGAICKWPEKKSGVLVAIVRNNASRPVLLLKAIQDCVLFAEELFWFCMLDVITEYFIYAVDDKDCSNSVKLVARLLCSSNMLEGDTGYVFCFFQA